MLASTALIKAKELISPNGMWCKRHLATKSGAHCIIGALNAIKRSNFSEERSFLVKALPYPWFAPTYYNDAPGTRKKQILRLFDKAIALAKAEGK